MTLIANVKYVNAAKDGKKFGSVVDNAGTRFMVPTAMVSQFEAGKTYDVPTKQEKWGESLVTVVAGFASPAAAGSSQPQPYVPPPRAQIATYTPGPAPSNSDHKDALIFVTGLVGRAMGSGKFVASDMTDLTSEAVKAWLFLKEQMK